MFTGEETSDDSNKFMQFMDRPVEGGQNIPMFNYDKVTVDGMPESNKEDTEPRDTDTEPRDTESEVSVVSGITNNERMWERMSGLSNV